MKPIFIISGDKGSGKTSFLLNLIYLLRSKGFIVYGFVSLHDIYKDVYILNNIDTNEELLLMQRVGDFTQRPKHFVIIEDSVRKGNEWINAVLDQHPDLAVIDEIGGFELSDRLWNEGFTKLLESSIPIIFTTKSKHLEQVKDKWNIDPTLIFTFGDFDLIPESCNKIIKLIKRE